MEKKERSSHKILMEKFPFLRENVMVYNDGENPPLLINPYRNSPQKLSRLSKNEVLLLQRLTGHNKTKDICYGLPIEGKETLNTLKKWSDKEWNMVGFLKVPVEEARTIEEKLVKYRDMFICLHAEVNSAQQASEAPHLLKEYHQKVARTAIEQFEHVETTVSHIYKEPHILLGGKSYGTCFADVLMQTGALREGISVLEVGGGTGAFGRSLLDEIMKVAPKVYRSIKYTFFEVSPVLLRSQQEISKRHNRITRFIQGDIQNHNFEDEKFDLIISNEMIADLAIAKLKKTYMKHPGSLPKSKRRAIFLIKKLKLDISDAPKEFLFNLGAVEFLETIKKILKPGAKAYIVEYGNEWSYPKALHLRDHTEYSVHFGLLIKAAKQLNINPQLTPLIDFLPFNKEIRVINRISWSYINNYLLPFLNRKKIPQLVYTEDMMREKVGEVFDQLSFIGFSHVGSGETSLDPVAFWVLSLESEKHS